MRYWSWFLLLCLLPLLPAHAEEGEFGIIKGTVKMADGTPCAGVQVVVKVGDRQVALTAGADGAFQGVAPAGKGTVTAAGAVAEVTITAGNSTTVTLTGNRTGIILAVSYADHTPAEVTAFGYCRWPGGSGRKVFHCKTIAPGQYWFTGLPAGATEFAIGVYQSGTNNTRAIYRRQWKLDKPEDLRTFTLEVARVVNVKLAVVGGNGTPFVNAALRGRFTYDEAPIPEGGAWNTDPIPERLNTTLINGKTDEKGMLALGTYPAGKYILSLNDDKGTGAPVAFEVKADGTVTLDKYLIASEPRQIMQTVFTADSKPAANATVFASYAWKGKTTIARAVADAAGMVVWKDVPPVRVIVWGPAVPAGVIPADAVKVIAPLPTPVPEKGTFCRFVITNAGPAPVTFIWYAATRGQTQEWTWRNPDGKNPVPTFTLTAYDFRLGAPMTTMFVTKTAPRRAAVFNSVYLPFSDDGSSLTIETALQEAGGTLTWRFTGADGKAVPAVSRVKILPVKLATDVPSFQMDNPRENLPLAEVEEPGGDGTYRYATLYCGTYRLQVDLYDDAAPSLPQFLLEVKPGAQELTIPLPAPLLTVPAGTEISYLPQHAPARCRRLVAGAQALKMPVFGPAASLPAWWYPKAPNLLATSRLAGDGKRVEALLPLRTVFLAPKYTDGKPYTGQVYLLPLFPGVLDTYPQFSTNGSHLSLRSDEQLIQLDKTGGYRAELWPGKYLAVGDVTAIKDPGSHFRARDAVDFRTVIEVPAQGPVVIPVPVRPRERPQQPGVLTTKVNVVFPTGKYAEWLEKGARYLVFTFDSRPGYWYLVARDVLNNPKSTQVTVDIPADAGQMSIRWLGVGAIEGVALPKPAGREPITVTLPAWQDGAVLSGRVLRVGGAPAAGQRLSIIARMPQAGENAPVVLVDELRSGSRFGPPSADSVQVITDARGAFSVRGMASGIVFVSQGADDYHPDGWVLTVPPGGLADVALRLTEQPVQISTWWWENRTCWWLPDGGTPVLILGRSHNVPSGTGWLWDVSHEGWMTAACCTLQLGDNNISIETAGPSLGIIFPLDASLDMPGGVTVRGQGMRAGVTVSTANIGWQPNPALGIIAGQLILPPGDYRVTVRTPRGPVEAPVTVGDEGAVVRLAYPVEK